MCERGHARTHKHPNGCFLRSRCSSVFSILLSRIDRALFAQLGPMFFIRNFHPFCVIIVVRIYFLSLSLRKKMKFDVISRAGSDETK